MLTSPLRYPGGKASFYPFFASLIDRNSLFGSTYYEPYAGGAGLALKLLSSGFVSRICINDIDDAIYSFWKSAIDRSDDLCDIIYKTPITIQEWLNQRDIWRANNTKDRLKLGFSAYFLNRTNRSGIIDGAGPIGGYAQSGKWKIDVRLVKEAQIANIQMISQFQSQIQVTNYDASQLISSYITDKTGIFYLDPPYYIKGKNLYKNFYNHQDHVRIANTLMSSIDERWIVSYDDVAEIRKIYQPLNPIIHYPNYSAGRKGIGREVIFKSNSLLMPSLQRFPQIASDNIGDQL